mgnify:CR=1 FL=1
MVQYWLYSRTADGGDAPVSFDFARAKAWGIAVLTRPFTFTLDSERECILSLRLVSRRTHAVSRLRFCTAIFRVRSHP